jgi:hypothetical protein
MTSKINRWTRSLSHFSMKNVHWLPRTHTFLFFSFLAVSGDSDLNRNPARRKQNRRQFPRSQGCPGHEFYHLDILGIMWKQTSGCYLRAPLHWNEVGEKEQRAKCNSLGIDDEGPGSIPRLQLRSRVLSHVQSFEWLDNSQKWRMKDKRSITLCLMSALSFSTSGCCMRLKSHATSTYRRRLGNF